MLADKPHGRRLTAAEQMRLEQLERQLSEDDPRFAAAFGTGGTGSPPQAALPSRVLVVIAGVAVAMVLLAALIGGAGGALAVAATAFTAAAGWRYLQQRRQRR